MTYIGDNCRGHRGGETRILENDSYRGLGFIQGKARGIRSAECPSRQHPKGPCT